MRTVNKYGGDEKVPNRAILANGSRVDLRVYGRFGAK